MAYYLILLIIIVIIIIVIVFWINRTNETNETNNDNTTITPTTITPTTITSTTITSTTIGQNGHLGNQLFQLAAIIGIAHDNDIKPILSDTVLNSQLGQLLDLSQLDIKSIDHTIKINETQQGAYERIVIPKDGRIYDIYGYFQSYLYFVNIKNKIHDLFKIKQELIDDVISKFPICTLENSIGIHVRRGDYINEENIQIYTQCTIAYYITALAQILSKIRKPQSYHIIIVLM